MDCLYLSYFLSNFMSLLEHITTEYKLAMKHKLQSKKMILNMVLAEAKKKKIDTREEVTDDDIVKIVKKEEKAVREALGFLKQAGISDERVDEEKAKLAVLEEYLPVMMSQEHTEQVVQETIEKLNIQVDNTQDIQSQKGKIMWLIMKDYKGQIDGQLVRKIVESL